MTRYVLCPACGTKNRLAEHLTRPLCGSCAGPLRVPLSRRGWHMAVAGVKYGAILLLVLAVFMLVPLWRHARHTPAFTTVTPYAAHPAPSR